jgi:hypothetical protein
MVNKRSWLGILAMVLIFGMVVPGCVKAQSNIGNTIGNLNIDVSLNGTWINEFKDSYIFNNGNYEYFNGDTLVHKGTYTTSNNKIIMCKAYFRNVFDRNLKLSSKNDFENWLRSKIKTGEITEEYSTELLNTIFELEEIEYSTTIDGNTLTLEDNYYKKSFIYTRIR